MKKNVNKALNKYVKYFDNESHIAALSFTILFILNIEINLENGIVVSYIFLKILTIIITYIFVFIVSTIIIDSYGETKHFIKGFITAIVLCAILMCFL